MKDIGKALRHLFPNARVGVAAGANPDYIIAADEYGDEQIVLWKLPQAQPTEAEIAAAAAAYETAETQRQADASTLRQGILIQANAAVGVPYSNVTNAMLKALLWILLWRAGALNKDLTIKPLGEWVKD